MRNCFGKLNNNQNEKKIVLNFYANSHFLFFLYWISEKSKNFGADRMICYLYSFMKGMVNGRHPPLQGNEKYKKRVTSQNEKNE